MMETETFTSENKSGLSIENATDIENLQGIIL